LVARNEGGDLVVASGNLAFDEDDELEEHANLSLALVLGLELVGDVLPRDELLLQVSSLLGSEFGSLELVLNVRGILKSVFQLELDLKTEGQMLGIQLLRDKLVWNLSGQVLVDLVSTLGLCEV
jgi:hypothetical protein